MRIAGIVLSELGLLVLLALAINWLRPGYWVALSLIDSIALVSGQKSADMTVWVSDSDTIYFRLADMPLYALLLAAGVLLVGGSFIKRDFRARAQFRDPK